MIDAVYYFLFKKRRQKYLEDMYQMIDPWSAELSRPRIETFLKNRLTKPFNECLDVGCGEGLFTEALSSVSRHYTGVDVSKTAIQRAKSRNIKIQNAEFLIADFDELEKVHQKYDLLCFNFVLDYLGFQKHPKQFSRYLYTALKTVTSPDCTVVIFNPVYKDEEFEKTNQYIYLFNNFGFRVVYKEIIQENTFKIACIELQKTSAAEVKTPN